ncbi:MAG TPA: 3D domain-containing protein [Fimbriimonadaceae bacterium]|nr:3D domain-containing protein [Fimbriimonadaceae bacterium]
MAAAMMAMLASASGVRQSGDAEKGDSVRVEVEKIPFEVKYEFSRTVGPGRVVKVQNGEHGEIRRTYQVHFKDGKPVGKTLIETERVEPKTALFYMGRKGYTVSRSASYKRKEVRVMTATAYDPSPRTIGRGATGRTATGLWAGYGHVAVDPRVIPLGTRVFVEGYGFAIASDTGGAIKGNKIDLCYNDRATALRFGRKKVTVHIFHR